MTAKPIAATVLFLAAAASANADTVGNGTVKGGGTCQAVAGTLPLKVDQIPASAPDTTVFRLTLLVAGPGAAQPQYLVAKVTQAGKATSGSAQVFNNGFLGGSGPFLNGGWTGKFPATNAFASVDVGPLTVTAGSCTLVFSNGQAIF